MTEQTFDASTRHAAAVSRRGSLMTLGGASLAALVGTTIVEAKKPGKKAKKRARKQGKQKCKKQVGRCNAFLADFCVNFGGDVCEVILATCCGFLGQCQTTAFFDCFVDAF